MPVFLKVKLVTLNYLLAIPPAVAPNNKNVVSTTNMVLFDTDEKQQQIRSKRDPIEKLIRFDIVSHTEFWNKHIFKICAAFCEIIIAFLITIQNLPFYYTEYK